jgi:hypothetical protein
LLIGPEMVTAKRWFNLGIIFHGARLPSGIT